MDLNSNRREYMENIPEKNMQNTSSSDGKLYMEVKTQ
jgi:hypothetical protein